MAFEPPVAVFDACVLYPFHLRNILVQAAVDGLVEARWTDAVHEEWIEALAAGAPAPAVPRDRLQIARRLMNEALPRATTVGYESHMGRVELPDPDDRHVVAAGIAAGASIIVTWNERHFPAETLRAFGLRTKTPDALLRDLYVMVPDLVVGSLANARLNLKKSHPTASLFIEIIANQRLVEFATLLREQS